MNKYVERIYNGVWKENPSFVQMLGLCPTLAVTTSATNGIGMGLSTTAVLVAANFLVSALRNIIPEKLRLPGEIVVVASLVTIVDMLMEGFTPDLYSALGIYIPLIVVNCIILGRAEMFASKNGIVDSALDGIGMGIGFTITLTIMGTIREILGSGTWMAGLGELIPALGKDFVIQVLPESIDPFTIMTSAPGGFFVFGVMMAAATWLTTRPKKAKAAAPAEAVEGGNV